MLDLSQMNVLRAALDESDHRPARLDSLADPHLRVHVPVLEGASGRALNAHPFTRDAGDRARSDRVHGLAIGRRDVDALVKREPAVAGQERVTIRRSCEDRSRVAERTPNWVRPVERLDGPGIRARASLGR